MADPLIPPTDPSILTTYGNTIATVALSMLGAIATVIGAWWNILSRLKDVENLGGQVTTALAEMKEAIVGSRDDLRQHEDEDYVEFGKIHEKFDGIVGPLNRVDESTEWIKKSIDTLTEDRHYAHERIKQHDMANEAHAQKLEKEVMEIIQTKEKKIAELEAQVAALTK